MRTALTAVAIALAAAVAHAEDYHFEIKNCRSEDITVRVYNGDDTLRVFPKSGWEDMKKGQTIGFMCDERGRNYCIVSVTYSVSEREVAGNTYQTASRGLTCFVGHAATNYLWGDCAQCQP